MERKVKVIDHATIEHFPQTELPELQDLPGWYTNAPVGTALTECPWVVRSPWRGEEAEDTLLDIRELLLHSPLRDNIMRLAWGCVKIITDGEDVALRVATFLQKEGYDSARRMYACHKTVIVWPKGD